MAACFHCVSRAHVTACDSYFFKLSTSRCFQGPDLRLAALGILDLQVDPGMWHHQVYFLDHTLDIHECIFVLAVRVMPPNGERGTSHTERRNAEACSDFHSLPPSCFRGTTAPGASIRPWPGLSDRSRRGGAG